MLQIGGILKLENMINLGINAMQPLNKIVFRKLKKIWTQHLFGPKTFLDTTFLGHKIFLNPIFFGGDNTIFFDIKSFWDQKLFWTKHFFGHQIFLDSKCI